MSLEIAEIARRLENIIRLGVVEQADYNTARVRIRSGDMLTGWLPWLTSRASNDRTWWAPEIGEQVIIFCPSGDPAQGIVMHGIYQSNHPANENNPDVMRADFSNGTFVEHNRSTGKLTISAAGDIDIIAAGNVQISGQRIDLN